ncbi:MAG: TolC family protein [Verrucomicrobiota bacterium]|jgi:outer membrane protein TolC
MEHSFQAIGVDGRASSQRNARALPLLGPLGSGGACAVGLLGICLFVTSCKSPEQYRTEADKVAYDIIASAQETALGKQEPFTIDSPAEMLRKKLIQDQELPISSPASLGTQAIEPIEQWPDKEYFTREELEADENAPWLAPGGMKLTLLETLQVAARNSREFQSQKENVFSTALRLDLARDAFRGTWQGNLDNTLSTDLSGEEDVSGLESKGGLGWTKQLQNGASFGANLGLDLVKLLTQDKSSSMGIYGDASISIPLLRGSGKFIVTEPLTQAERDVIYSIYQFERYKKTFSVSIANSYLGVLQSLDGIENAARSYERSISTTRRTRRNADAGKATETEVLQAISSELTARQRWISAQESYRRSLDSFKMELGLPLDAEIELDRTELESLRTRMSAFLDLAEEDALSEENIPDADALIVLEEPTMENAGQYEFDPREAVIIALEKRLDLRTAIGQVFDAQRQVAIAADQLRADLTLLGNGSAGASRGLGSADQDDADFDPSKGRYSALLNIDLPLERTSERNSYRNSLISLESAVRSVQELEDRIKLAVRNGLSSLQESREQIRIGSRALEVAKIRVDSEKMKQEAGLNEIRDVLEAQNALVEAEDSLTASLITYRLGELQIQVDMDILEVDENGLWTEFVSDEGGEE